jgi:hypothetical protein
VPAEIGGTPFRRRRLFELPERRQVGEIAQAEVHQEVARVT